VSGPRYVLLASLPHRNMSILA